MSHGEDEEEVGSSWNEESFVRRCMYVGTTRSIPYMYSATSTMVLSTEARRRTKQSVTCSKKETRG